VWIVSKAEYSGGYAIAKLKRSKSGLDCKWEADDTQPAGADSYGIAVDDQGNPAFISMDKHIHWKRDGKWESFEGCVTRIAFGASTFFKLSCDDNFVHKLVGNKWV
jgi:hypothetical protein